MSLNPAAASAALAFTTVSIGSFIDYPQAQVSGRSMPPCQLYSLKNNKTYPGSRARIVADAA
jgi:hypothetical protein